MKTREPDWDELKKIGELAAQAKQDGALDYAAWRGFIGQANLAANGNQEFLEFLFTEFAQPGWIKRLMADTRSKRSRRAA